MNHSDNTGAPVTHARLHALPTPNGAGWTVCVLGAPPHVPDVLSFQGWDEFQPDQATERIIESGWQVVERDYEHEQSGWLHHGDGSWSATVTPVNRLSFPAPTDPRTVGTLPARSRPDDRDLARLDATAQMMGTTTTSLVMEFFAYHQGETDVLPQRPRDQGAAFNEAGRLDVRELVAWFTAWYVGDVDVCPPRAATTEGS